MATSTGSLGGDLMFPNEARSVSRARQAVRERMQALGLEDLSGPAELVVDELVANAVLHTGGPVGLEVAAADGGVRLSVYDTSPLLPIVPTPSESSMTGRGLLLVRSVAACFGFGPTDGGKVVWAEVGGDHRPGDAGADQLIEAWADEWDSQPEGGPGHRIELGDVPTDLLLDAKAHVDNLVREFLLAAAGAESGSTAAVPPHLAELIEAVVNRFSDARLAIKRQALDAARQGLSHVRLRLDLGPESADAAGAYLRALDEADAYCRAARLLTLETPPKHRVFRHWYVGEIISQLHRADAGLPPAPTQQFEQRLLEEIDAVAAARAGAERAARLFAVTSALAAAMTPEAVADAVLREGVAALGASGGGLVLPTGNDRLAVPGTLGYDDWLVQNLRAESSGAELPAAVALRTGEPVWLESREERDARFPQLAGFERGAVAMCAVPLCVADRLIGALRFSFSKPRLFGEDERRFVLALAAQAAQALDRAQAYEDRSEMSRRLQRSLLPPALPDIPGVEVAASYAPLGRSVEVGGDFYDVWSVSGGEWAFALGDVSGTGPEAAGLTALVRYSLRALTTPGMDHAALLHRLNEVLLNTGADEERFCTAVLGSLRAGRDGVRIRLATGGHPEPLIRRAGGDITFIPTDGSLLGILPSIDVAVHDVDLAAGDGIVFYTDGVTEARSEDGVMFGTEGLAEAVGRGPADAAGTTEAVESAVVSHRGGTLDDDMAVLVFRATDG